MRRAARRDANEKDLVSALEARGITIVRLSMPGWPDLCVPFRGRVWFFEVKNSNGRGRRLTPAQQKLRLLVPFTVVETGEDILRTLGVLGDTAGCPLCRGLGWVKKPIPCVPDRRVTL